eukprot:TRINITY_DN4336_c0_g1_i3.p1 TRINITY_DN4336_c0_g1~~TRINITY_DN4336_c0_g1_i3.p1  ORF type:complete len:184 (+),score=18.85 TRINITY_DN4336_c0_g1_i3:201-752(+)
MVRSASQDTHYVAQCFCTFCPDLLPAMLLVILTALRTLIAGTINAPHIPDVSDAALLPHFPEIVEFIHTARQNPDHVVYIHCAAGVSRSSTATLAYMMSHLLLSFQHALDHLQRAHGHANPNRGFKKQLETFESDKEDVARSKIASILSDTEKYPRADELREMDLAFVAKLLHEHALLLQSYE